MPAIERRSQMEPRTGNWRPVSGGNSTNVASLNFSRPLEMMGVFVAGLVIGTHGGVLDVVGRGNSNHNLRWHNSGNRLERDVVKFR